MIRVSSKRLRATLGLISLAVLIAGVCVFFTRSNGLPARKYSNTERLSLVRLKAVHEDVQRLQGLRQGRASSSGWNDYRCIFHAHAEDSAHTGGTLPEMLTEAKKAGVSAIFLSDHFRPPRDFIEGRWRGMKDGVLFIPGSETGGFLVHPMQSILDKMQQTGSEFVKSVTAGDGMIFLSHIEERPDYAIEGLTGLEIYNRHWDAKRDISSLLTLALKLTDPKALGELEEAVRLYPDELLAFQCDYPQVYLEKWDAGTQIQRLTGVAANDCHHNQVLVIKMVDPETVLLGTIVDQDDQMRKVTALFRPGIKQMTQGRKPGDILARVDLDPYHRSFKNVSTHVLAPTLDEAALRTAVKAGHVYVGHDWMCDPTGFSFEAVTSAGKSVAKMGDEVMLVDGLTLAATFPLPAHVRLLLRGEEIATGDGKSDFAFSLKTSGVYRLEAWLRLDGELRPWIFSNPIYVR